MNAFLALLTPGDILYLQEDNNSTNFQKWVVSASIVIQTGYVEVPVTLVSSGGTGTTNFANNLQIILAIFLEGADGPQGFQGISGSNGATGSVGGFTIIYNTSFNIAGFTSSVLGISDPDLTYGDMYISFFDKNNIDLTAFYTELKNAINTSSPSQAQYIFLKIFSTSDSTQFGLYKVPISGFQLYSEGVYIYHTDMIVLSGNITTPSEIGLSFLLNPGDVGINGSAGADGNVGGLSISYFGMGYAVQPAYINQYLNYDQIDLTINGTLYISKVDMLGSNNIDFFTALYNSMNSSSPSGNGVGFIEIFSTTAAIDERSYFSFIISDVVSDTDGLTINNLTYLGGNLINYTDPVSIGFLLNSGESFATGITGSTPYFLNGNWQTTSTNIFNDGNVVGIGSASTSTASSTLQVYGSLSLDLATTSTDYLLGINNFTLLCYPSISGLTVSLPPAIEAKNRVYVIKKVDLSTQSNVNIYPYPGDNIEGYSDSLILTIPWDYNMLQSDGTNMWIKLGGVIGLNI